MSSKTGKETKEHDAQTCTAAADGASDTQRTVRGENKRGTTRLIGDQETL